MPTPYEIGSAGGKIAISQLIQSNWIVTRSNTSLAGSTDIEAQTPKGTRKILVQVKSAVTPNEPAHLSSDERRNIISRASKIGAEAWEAIVWLDNNLNKISSSWKQFS